MLALFINTFLSILLSLVGLAPVATGRNVGDCCGCIDCCATGKCFPGCCPCDCGQQKANQNSCCNRSPVRNATSVVKNTTTKAIGDCCGCVDCCATGNCMPGCCPCDCSTSSSNANKQTTAAKANCCGGQGKSARSSTARTTGCPCGCVCCDAGECYPGCCPCGCHVKK